MPKEPKHSPIGNTAGVTALTLIGALLYGSGIVGIAYVAGFSSVWHHLQRVDGPWVVASLAGVALSWLGYYIAFEGLARIPGGPELNRTERLAVVAAGFGCFLFKGGAVIDNFAMRQGGTDKRVADVRVSALKSLEHAPIAIGTCIAAIVLLALGRTDPPPLDFTWPWALGPVIGTVIALMLAARYREGLRSKKGVLGGLAVALDGIWMLRELAVGKKSSGMPFIGMTIFWAGDMFALWAALLAFTAGISFADVIVAYAVGNVLTRRSAPLGGAGLIDLVLPLTLWACGASFGGAVAAVAVYRFFSLWVPLPGAIAALPTVRAIEEPDAKPMPTREPALQGAS